MITEVLVRYAHFIGLFTMISSLVGEHLLVEAEMSRQKIRRLALVDAIYGLSAIVVVAAGLSLWLTGIGKPADFYTHNPLFLLKVGLAIVAGLLSLVPTVFFLKERKGSAEELVKTPKRIVFFIRLQLFILVFLPLLATLMAKGVGYQAPN